VGASVLARVANVHFLIHLFICRLQGGPPQNVMLWRNFAALSRATEVANTERNAGADHVYPSMEECAVREGEELAQIEMQSFNIVLALMESLEQGCKEVKLEPIEFEGRRVR